LGTRFFFGHIFKSLYRLNENQKYHGKLFKSLDYSTNQKKNILRIRKKLF
jgi:hypothetical protein